jgi:hypothetical protein
MAITDISRNILILAIISTGLPLWVFILNATQLGRLSHVKIIVLVLVVSATSDVASYFFSHQHIHTTLLFNIQDLIQFGLLSLFYYQISYKQNATASLTKITFLAGSVMYLVCLVLISIFVQDPIEKHQNFAWSLSAIILIVYSLMYCLDLLITSPLRKDSASDGLIWINSGILYYFSFSLILFLTMDYIVNELKPEVARLIWSYNNVNNIIKNICITIGLAFIKRAMFLEQRV